MKFSNEYTVIEFDMDAKEISGRDLRDSYNEPSCYNKTSRSIKRALSALSSAWNDNMTMYQACEIIRANGVQMRTYCAMD